MFTSAVARRLVKSSLIAKSTTKTQPQRAFSLLVPLSPKEQFPAELQEYPLTDAEFSGL